MSSRNQEEVEKLKNELRKAGIATETRRDPTAKAMGVNAIELWVQDRDGKPADKPHGDTSGLEKSDTKAAGSSGNGVNSKHTSQPRPEELKHASSLLEKGITEMFRRESELARECASLRSKVEELTQALALEIESRVAAEKTAAEKISRLASTLERERHEWQQQLKSRDESLKNAQEKLGSMSRLVQTQQSAALALEEQIVSLEMQREEQEVSLCNARTEALAEREARIAAEERAEKAELDLQKQLVNHTELEQQMHAHLASLNSLFGRMDRKGAPGLGKP